MKELKKYHIGPKTYYIGELDSKGFVIKSKVVDRICKDYINYNIKLSLINEFNDLCEDEESYSNDTNYKMMGFFVKYIKTIIEQLDDINREIIINEFINRKENWWIEKYKRSTYYRYRLDAVSVFLRYVF